MKEEQFIEWVGIVAGIFTAASMLPQLVKLIREKKAGDISLFFLLMLFFGVGLWIWYGVLRQDLPIIVTNSFSLLVNLAMIILGIKYKKRDK